MLASFPSQHVDQIRRGLRIPYRLSLNSSLSRKRRSPPPSSAVPTPRTTVSRLDADPILCRWLDVHFANTYHPSSLKRVLRRMELS